MKPARQNQRLGHNFLPFCAGIACGIFISIFLFLLFASPAIFHQLLPGGGRVTDSDEYSRSLNPVQHEFGHKQPGGNDVLGVDRKLSQDERAFIPSSNQNKSIPIQVQPDPILVEDPAWESKLSPVHIPGYLSQELKLKKKVFVAILNPSMATAPIMKLLQKTWAKDWIHSGNGDMTIYTPMGSDVRQSSEVKVHHLSVLPKDALVPSSTMLYQALGDLCSQHIDTHQHFFIANSNSYINLPRLLNFTNHLDEMKLLWIGKKVITAPAQKQFTNDPELYCATGPGFLLSRNALQMLCPRLQTCQVEYSADDVDLGLLLGRCLKRFLNINCTYSEKDFFYEMVDHFLDPYSDTCPYKESISLHPVSDENSLFKLHHFFLNQQLNETKRMNEYYHNVIQNMDRVLVQEGGMADDRLILGRDGNANRYQHGDVITWDLIESINKGSYKLYTVDGGQPSRDLTFSDEIVLNKVKSIAKKQMEDTDGIRGRLSTGNVFRRVVPGVGYQYMVDLRKDNKEVATVYVDQPYDRMQAVSTHLAPDVTVNFVLPLQDGSPYFKEFMQMFEQACMSVEQAEKISLLVILYVSPSFDQQKSETLSLLNLYKQKYHHLSLRWINAQAKPYSHVEGTAMAIQALHSDMNDKTLICSTHLFTQMSPEFLHHAKLNTIHGEQLFFPIPFQRLNTTDENSEEISKSNGFWRTFDYSTFCGYKQDITRACGGEAFKSGADLYEQALTSGLDVFRAPEHALSAKWHERDCHDVHLAKSEQKFCGEMSKNLHLSASVILR
ncbi:chondroitin sulfate synthase 1-like isoform X2 [Clavelina lepadiformis]|uniref:chondroitin sulfate synthase 1-like isoform X2 n=1 Tax=Clavelina lepadiformis TaxID=159417 RepID=UPI004042D250